MHPTSKYNNMGIQINRIKAVLAENKRTNRWLAESLGKNEATVSRWCTNETQPSVEVFFKYPNYWMLILEIYLIKQNRKSVWQELIY